MSEPQRKYVEAALESVARLVVLNQELAHFPVAQAFQLEVVDFHGLLVEVVAEARRTLATNNVALVGDFEELLTSVGDREKLVGAFHGILAAASRSAGPDGRIAIGAREEDEQIVIEIRASGSATALPGDAQLEILAARRVCRLHGGSLVPARDGPFAVTIELPRIQPEECS